MLKFLHAADIHLDSPLLKLEQYEGAPADTLRQATRRAFENLVDLALKEKVDFVLIAGDLYDGDWKDFSTGLFFTTQASKLRQAGIQIFLVSGNHDAENTMTRSLRLPEGVHRFDAKKPETVLLDDFEIPVAIHGQSFPSKAVTADLSDAYPEAVEGRFNIGLLHTSATGREGHADYAPCTPTGLQAKGYDYWALGHVHKREVLCEDPYIAFPGNLQGRNIRETGPKGCLLATVDGRLRIGTEFRPLDVLRWEHCELDGSGLKHADDILDALTERFRGILEQAQGLPLAIRATISGPCPVHDQLAARAHDWIPELRNRCLDAFGDRIWLEKIRVRTHPPEQPSKNLGQALEELLDGFEQVQADEAELLALGGSLDLVWAKIPKEFKTGDTAADPEDPEWLRDMLDQAKSLLLERLLHVRDKEGPVE